MSMTKTALVTLPASNDHLSQKRTSKPIKMIKAAVSIFLLSLLSQLAAGSVVSLTAENYEATTAGKTVFIKFFAPWCGHCRSMADDWETLSEEWKDHAVGLIAEVDCTTDDGIALCEDFEVQGFPTLLYGDPLSPETYEGDRTYEELAAFAKENISNPICNVFKTDHCSDAEKQDITLLQGKTQAELEAMAVATEDEVKAAEEIFDKDVEQLQKQFDDMVKIFNEKLEVVKKEHNYKFVEQILASMESTGANTDGGDEL